MNRYVSRFQAMSLRRRIATVLIACMAIAVFISIFLFSSEGKGASGSRSARVTGWLVSLFHGADLTPEAHAALVEQWGHTVRKLAHMTEFATLTATVAAFLITVRPIRSRPRRWTEWVIPFVLCVLYAAADEIHQIFSHRGPSVKDVLIDCAGGLIGLCVLHLLVYAVSCIRARRRGMLATEPGVSSCS